MLLLNGKKSVFIAACLLTTVLLNSCSSNNSKQLVQHYNEKTLEKALIMADSGMLRKSLAIVDSAYTTFPYISVADRYRYYLFMTNMYASYYSPLRDIDKALIYEDSMLKVIEKNGMQDRMAREYAVAYEQKGTTYKEQGRYSDALNCFSQSRFVAERLGDSCLMSQYYFVIGEILYHQLKYKDAIAMYQQALADIKYCGDDERKYANVQRMLDDLGGFYYKCGMLDSALAYYNKAEFYIESHRQSFTTDPNFPDIALGVVYGNQGVIMHEKGDEIYAERLLKKSIAINSRQGFDNKSAYIVSLRLAKLYLETGRPDKALQIIEGIKPFLPVLNDDANITWLQLMQQYYKAGKTKALADSFYIAWLKLKDSIDVKNLNLIQNNANETFTKLHSNYNISLLQKSNTLKQNYLLGVIVFSVLLVVIALLIMFNLRRSKSHIKVLTSLNNEINKRGRLLEELLDKLEQKNREKDRIMRVVAHDLRSPIGSINMLGGMMAELKDPVKAKNYLRLIQLACSDSLELVNEILNMVYNTDDVTLHKKIVDINTLADDCVALMHFAAEESVYPNPVARTEKLHITMSNMDAGKYTIQLFGSDGKQLIQQAVQYDGSAATQSLALPASIAAGSYRLIIFDEKGNTWKQQVIIQ